MDEYVWDDSVKTGHEMIDEQHKQLFAAVNALLKACRENKGNEELIRGLNFLSDYTIKHFFDEEQVQQQFHYPDYPNHKKLHENFKSTVRDMKVRLIMKGPSKELIDDVRAKIGNWLVTHIKGNDIKLGKYIKEQSAAAGTV
jgi:hemerythrin-like metal-binding protein